MLSIDTETVRLAESFSKTPKKKQAEEEAREGYEQIIDNRELLAVKWTYSAVRGEPGCYL